MGTVAEWGRAALERYRRGDLAGAEKLLRRVLQSDPAHADALLLRGDIRLRAGDPRGAEDCFRRVLQANAGHVGARMGLGTALQGQGRSAAAAREFKRVIEAAPALAEPHIRVGAIAAGQGQLREAERHFLKAVSCEPDNAGAHFNLGLLYGNRAWWPLALKELEAAVRLAPAWALARQHYGSALLQAERLAEAVEQLERALELDGNLAEARIQLGLAWHKRARFDAGAPERERRHRYDRAIAALREAAGLAPQSGAAHERLGCVFFDMERYDEAAEAFARALAVEPTRYEANVNYGLTLRQLGDERRQALLARLDEPHRFADPAEATPIAVELARTCPYPDEVVKAETVRFLEGFEPGALFPARWWEDRLGRFGPRDAAPDKLLRSVFSLVFSWSIPAREALEAVARFAGDRRVFSYGAGRAYWEFLLSSHFGLRVAASDIEVGHRFMEVERADLGAAPVDPDDLVFVGWILNQPEVVASVMRLLEAMTAGQRLVIVGEPPDALGRPRSCGSEGLFRFLREHFQPEDPVPLPRFAHLHDVVNLYQRR